ncbi:ABC-2 family transporter protein [Frankineae bacterium MT45]|nr:ABC-2 family transporter protein [Frankineae bacterium MT45]
MSTNAVLDEQSLPAVPPLSDRAQAQPVTLGRVLNSEWIKFRTLRSTLAVLFTAIGGMLLIAVVVGYNTRRITFDIHPDDIVPSSVLQGYYLAQLLIGALGVLFVTGEYSTGMIRSTFAAVPQRVPVVWAKLGVFVVISLVTMVITSLVAFLASEAIIGHYRTGYSLSDPGVLRVVVGTGVYLTLIGVIGMMLGWIVRSTPGALVAYIATILVLPVLFGNGLGSWGRHIARYLPSEAGGSFVSSLRDPSSLTPWRGLAVMAIWTIVAIVAGALLLRRRDA